MPPVVALGVPEDLFRLGEVAPVGVGLEEGLHDLLEQVADLARARIGHADERPLVIARTRHEDEAGAVGAPLDVGERPAAGHVVAHGGPVLIRGHVQADDAARRRRLRVDHHPVDAEDDRVFRERVAPRLEFRVPDLGRDHVHHPHAAGVVLEGGDAPRVGRPLEHGTVALHPARVVRRVAEVLDPVLRELGRPPRWTGPEATGCGRG